MARIFIAIRFDDEVKKALVGLQDTLKAKGVKGNYCPYRNLHMTLAFIGESYGLPEISKAVSEVEFEPFTMTLSKLGTFPTRAGVIWCGIKESKQVMALAKQLRERLTDHGVKYRMQAFFPHISLVQHPTHIITDIDVPEISITTDSIKIMKSERIDGELIYSDMNKTETIHQITFSPTGGTRRVSELLCKAMEAESNITELCTKQENLSYPQVSADDLVIISMPVYAGRVPALAVERLKGIKANGAKCVIVAVYGNRAYEDALVEMQDVCTEMGFSVIAAVAAIAEHSICRMYGAGRPDAEDAKELASFGAAIIGKAKKELPFEPLVLPGNRPYKQGCVGPYPVAGDLCTECGLCASECPTGAISPDNPKGNNHELCIGCMRCVKVCPAQTRGIGERLNMLVAHLKPLCSERKNNELFI